MSQYTTFPRAVSILSLVALANVVFASDLATRAAIAADKPKSPVKLSKKVQTVIERVERQCRERPVYMIGPEKAKRLAELVRQKKPRLVVECGTALGYSGLWIASQLDANGAGKLVTIEIEPSRSREAKQNFAEAGLADYVEAKVGNAREVVREIDGPIDFVFIDCGYSNYLPCLTGLEDELADGAIIVADNVGIGASGMKDYLDHVRKKYRSRTEWFELDLPWAKRDAMEVSVVDSSAGD